MLNLIPDHVLCRLKMLTIVATMRFLVLLCINDVVVLLFCLYVNLLFFILLLFLGEGVGYAYTLYM